MSYDLLIIEAVPTSAHASVRAALADDPEFRCLPIAWDAVAAETLRRHRPHAIVAIGEPTAEAQPRLIDCLRSDVPGTPLLAVLTSAIEHGFQRVLADVADDFLLMPLRAPELRQRLHRLLHPAGAERARATEQLLAELGMTQLVGTDPSFVRAIEQVPRFARGDAPVLITGETGTGKELCARAIHFLSARRDCPFVAVDCSTLPDQLVESELFGHVRGAYTDAHRDGAGLIAMAEGGTVFLDEIDALSFAAQAKLLRFLQERTFRPVGASAAVRADVNVIAATNRDLQVAVSERAFRADLYFRLNVLRLHLPPLRQRRDDIPLLAAHFLAEQSARRPQGPRSFSSGAVRALSAHSWPGNVRELANVVQRAALVCDGNQILPNHLLPSDPVDSEPIAAEGFRAARGAAMAAFERRYVSELLLRHRGNVTHAARAAGKERRAFGRLMKKHGIDRRDV